MGRFVCLAAPVVVALVLVGCAAAPPRSTSSEPPPTLDATARETASPVPSTQAPIAPPPIDSMLPVTLGGVELHTFAVGQDILERLVARLGVGIEQLEVRYASEHGARFLQMYALRVPGATGSGLVEAWVAVAYAPDVEDAASSQESVAGKDVVRVSAPSAAGRIGTFHLYADDDTLLVVQAFNPQVAAEALAALP